MKPCIAFVGASGVGKTTRMLELCQEFLRRGLQPGVVKHTHHPPSTWRDDPDTDTARFLRQGAAPVKLTRGALQAAVLNMPGCDLILVEGGKTSTLEKIEVLDRGRGFPENLVPASQLVAVLGDVKVGDLPRLDPTAPQEWADFLLARWSKSSSPKFSR